MQYIIKDLVRWFYWYPFRLSVRYIPRRFYFMMIKTASMIASRFIREKANEMREIFYRVVQKDLDKKYVQEVIEKSFANMYMSYAEVLCYPHINKNNIKRIVSIKGIEHLDRALSLGKGVILTVPHFGSPKMVWPAIGYQGYTMNVLSATSIWKELSGQRRKTKMYLHGMDIELNLEKKLPVSWLYIGEHTGIRDRMSQCLKRGEILLYGPDGGLGKKSRIQTRLGGLKMNISVTQFQLAQETGASILPGFLIRNRKFDHIFYIHEPIYIPQKKDKTDFSKQAQQLTDMIYDYFFKYPCQYLSQLWLLEFTDRLNKSN